VTIFSKIFPNDYSLSLHNEQRDWHFEKETKILEEKEDGDNENDKKKGRKLKKKKK
jgi:hypothetical protein